MTIRPKQSASERGIALIVVLLLMAVLSGLATGFALTGQTEVAMATNEVYFAGARAAAEAGLNRSLVEMFADTTTDWVAGTDGLVDATNASAAVNADNGSLFFLLGAGPYYVDSANRYSYEIQILDDDNDLLYETALTPTQHTAMSENGSVYTNTNQRVVLRAFGYGPNGTVVRIARIIESVATPGVPSTNTTLSNPALLVNGNFEMDGSISITGTNASTNRYGSVHTNGNLLKTGTSGTITGDATASGTADLAGLTPGGASGGGRPTINVPDVRAINYLSIADYKLAVVAGAGVVQTFNTSTQQWTACSTAACTTTGWSYSAGTWNLSNNPGTGTYYAEGNVNIGSTQGPSNRAVSVIATGNINMHGNAKLTPENLEKIQFVCDGDLDLKGDLTAPANIDGQILVRGQFDAGGSMSFQGRVIVQDVAGAGSLYTANRIHGSVNFLYGGTIGAVTTTTTTAGATTYVNNVSGWLEQ